VSAFGAEEYFGYQLLGVFRPFLTASLGKGDQHLIDIRCITRPQRRPLPSIAVDQPVYQPSIALR
jgi:hypothetical protein